jgi:hypothetical protein
MLFIIGKVSVSFRTTKKQQYFSHNIHRLCQKIISQHSIKWNFLHAIDFHQFCNKAISKHNFMLIRITP